MKSSRNDHLYLESGFLSALPSSAFIQALPVAVSFAMQLPMSWLESLLPLLYGIELRWRNGLHRSLLQTATQWTLLFYSSIVFIYFKVHPLISSLPLQVHCVPLEVLFSLAFFVLPPQQVFINSLLVLQKPRITPLLLMKNLTFPVISMHHF